MTPEIISLRDLAGIAGVPYGTAATWRKRALAAIKAGRVPRKPPLPPADALDDPPRWYRKTGVDWLIETDRLPEGSQ